MDGDGVFSSGSSTFVPSRLARMRRSRASSRSWALIITGHGERRHGRLVDEVGEICSGEARRGACHRVEVDARAEMVLPGVHC